MARRYKPTEAEWQDFHKDSHAWMIDQTVFPCPNCGCPMLFSLWRRYRVNRCHVCDNHIWEVKKDER